MKEPTKIEMHTINSENFQEGIPCDTTDVFISCDIDQILYKDIFKVSSVNVNGIGNTRPFINVKMHDSITEIQNEAFQHCSLIKSITMPKYLTNIGVKAFHFCKNLEVVNLPQQQDLQLINHNAFDYCKKLKQILIPDTVTEMGREAFANCYELQSVRLSKSLKSINESAFYCCNHLQSIDIPEGVTSIERSAFKHCDSLQSVILPQSLNSIQQETFLGCCSLISIIFCDSLNEIGKEAFTRCPMMQNIVIPKQCIYDKSMYSFDIGTKAKPIQLMSNYIDKIIHDKGQEWLKNRYDDLPFHQVCNQQNNISINELTIIPLALDEMNMTPLHVLSCNPHVTLDIIRELASKCLDAAFVETRNGMYALEMYLVTKNIVQVSNKNHTRKIVYDQSDEIRSLMRKGASTSASLAGSFNCNDYYYYNIHDIIKSDIRYDHYLWDIILAFQGMSMNKELFNDDKLTGLYPFMTAALTFERSLENVYELAMADPTLLIAKRSNMDLISKYTTYK